MRRAISSTTRRSRVAITISHLRFGPEPIRSTYLITKANFVACHQFQFLERIDVLRCRGRRRDFLLNTPFGPDEIWQHLPRKMQETIIEKKLQFYVIDGYAVARAAGMGGRINTIMQTCFFAISGVLPREEAIAADQEGHQEDVRQARRRSRAEELRRGRRRRWRTCTKSNVPATASSQPFDILPAVPERRRQFVRDVLGR